MKQRTPGVAAAVGIGLILVAGCDTTPPNATEALGTAASEALAADAASPSALDDRAFIRTVDDPALQWGPCPEFMPSSCELAVVQGDPEQPNADAFFKLEPGTSVAEHWHTSAERMVLLSGRVEVDYEGQPPVTMNPGIYAYGPAKLQHETHCLGSPGDDPCILFIAFEEPIDAIEGVPEEVPDAEAFIRAADDPDIQWAPCEGWMPGGCELAIIQGDPEQPNADVLFKLPPDSTVPLHWHTSAERMVLLSGELRVNYQGQAPVTAGPLTYAYGPAALPHDTRCGDAGECILFIAFEEPVDALEVRGGNVPQRR